MPRGADISLLLEELAFHRSSNKYLSENESKRLCSYYRNFSTSEYLSYLYVQNLIDATSRITPETTLLDAACGYGTEAIIFSLLGAKVVGIDLNEYRIRIAKRRTSYYEKRLGTPLKINFLPRNAVKYVDKASFDIVWVTNAISHIYPVDKFLSTAWGNLRLGGCLIVRDANKHNPYVFYTSSRAWRRRGRVIERIDPENGGTVQMGVENVYSVGEMTHLMRQANFHIESTHRYGFFPNLRVGAFAHLDELLSGAPLINRIALFYSIVGRREGDV